MEPCQERTVRRLEWLQDRLLVVVRDGVDGRLDVGLQLGELSRDDGRAVVMCRTPVSQRRRISIVDWRCIRLQGRLMQGE